MIASGHFQDSIELPSDHALQVAREGLEMAEGGDDEKAGAAPAGTHDVFVGFPAPNSSVAETRQ